MERQDIEKEVIDIVDSIAFLDVETIDDKLYDYLLLDEREFLDIISEINDIFDINLNPDDYISNWTDYTIKDLADIVEKELNK